MRDDESSLGVVGAIECVREKERTPGGISRIIYLKWQRRFREPKPHEDRVLIAVSRASGAFNSFPFFFLLPFLFNAQRPSPARYSIPRLTSSTQPGSQPPLPRYGYALPSQRARYTHTSYLLLHQPSVILAPTSYPAPPTHVSSPTSSHTSSSASPSMSSISRTASLLSRMHATLRPVLPFIASETSPLIHPASTYDRLIGMRTAAIYKHVSSSEIGEISFVSGI